MDTRRGPRLTVNVRLLGRAQSLVLGQSAIPRTAPLRKQLGDELDGLPSSPEALRAGSCGSRPNSVPAGERSRACTDYMKGYHAEFSRPLAGAMATTWSTDVRHFAILITPGAPFCSTGLSSIMTTANHVRQAIELRPDHVRDIERRPLACGEDHAISVHGRGA